MWNPAQELSILKFWKSAHVYEKLKARAKGKPFYFLQGPPYTSEHFHIGHAWNHTMKDIMLRYKRSVGLQVWDRAGYDMHGLPIENAVQKELKLFDKEAITKFGVDKFVQHCESYSLGLMKEMNFDVERLGVWLDLKNPYLPIKQDYIEGVWWLIKQASKTGRLYEGKKVLHWCPGCETALAKHELEYKRIKEQSVYVKLKLKNKQESLLVWTTTPWTLPFNLAVMANPELEYVKVKAKNEIFIIAKPLLTSLQNLLGEVKVIASLKGKQLEGLEYEAPFAEEFKEHYKKFECPFLHKVILSKAYVSAEEGTGLVHCAPGCGPEDFEVGQAYGLPPFNLLDEKGRFEWKGKLIKARTDDGCIIEELKTKGLLVALTPIEHDYPHCWRCKQAVVFRPTNQWFLKVEDLIPELLRANKKIKWVPKWTKSAFALWIKNLKDLTITRQRFWGTPAPLWKCPKCKKVTVIGSVKELKAKAATKVPSNLHRPWIDKVELKCSCGAKASRIPDVLDVWLDSGSASWNCLGWPKRKSLFKKFFPAEIVIEATEQIKLWFSMLLICSWIAFKRACFKNVYAHGMILDWQGMKMSKSLGNVISPYAVIDKYGADLFRYYMAETAAGQNINFSWQALKQKEKNLNVLWNTKNWVIDLSEQLKVNPERLRVKKIGQAERYILSKAYSTLEEVTSLLEAYRLDEIVSRIEKLWLEFSRSYIQLVRTKVLEGSKTEKQAVLYASYRTLLLIIKMFSLVAPFFTEAIYQELRKFLKEESIHLLEWPKTNKRLINKKIEKDFDLLKEIIEQGLAQRAKAKIGLRWPLPSLKLNTVLPKWAKELLKEQLNVKQVRLAKKKSKKIRVELDLKLNPELEAEGWAREIVRVIQDARKKAGLKKVQQIELALAVSEKLQSMLNEWIQFIKKRVNALKLTISSSLPPYAYSYEFRIKKEPIKLAFNLL